MRRSIGFNVDFLAAEEMVRRYPLERLHGELTDVLARLPEGLRRAISGELDRLRHGSNLGQEIFIAVITIALRDFHHRVGDLPSNAISDTRSTWRIAVDRAAHTRMFQVVCIVDTPEVRVSVDRPTSEYVWQVGNLRETDLLPPGRVAIASCLLDPSSFASAIRSPDVVASVSHETLDHYNGMDGRRHQVAVRARLSAVAYGIDIPERLCLPGLAAGSRTTVGFRVFSAVIGSIQGDRNSIGRPIAESLVQQLHRHASSSVSLCVSVSRSTQGLSASFYAVSDPMDLQASPALVAITLPDSPGWPVGAANRTPGILFGVDQYESYGLGSFTVDSQNGGNEAQSNLSTRKARPMRRLKLNRNNEVTQDVSHDQHLQRTDQVDQRLARRRRGASLQWYVDPDDC